MSELEKDIFDIAQAMGGNRVSVAVEPKSITFTIHFEDVEDTHDPYANLVWPDDEVQP